MYNNKYRGNINDFIERVNSYMRKNYDICIDIWPVKAFGAYEIVAYLGKYGRTRKIDDSSDFEDNVISFCNFAIKDLNSKNTI